MNGLVDGFTRSLWISLAVKSVRLGWPAGLHEARRHLSPSIFRSTLLVQVFEDILPPTDELATVIDEVVRGDVEALCARETHHGRGLTPQFCDLEQVSFHVAFYEPARIRDRVRALGCSLWPPPRALNVAWIWVQVAPTDHAPPREVDSAPWTGMPSCMADKHTYEGNARGTKVTLLSGTNAQQRRIAALVQEEGWSALRYAVHDGGKLEPSSQLRNTPWLF
jgi:hypothetical protein